VLAAPVLAAIVLAAMLLAGCAGADSGRRDSAAGCTAIATRAARGQVTLTGVPRPCRGLGPYQLSRTVKLAVSDVARPGTKSRRRHLVIQAYGRLAVLTTAADREAAAQRAARARRRAASPHGAPAQAAPRLRVPARVAALVAWLLAAASGAWLAFRCRAGQPRRPLPPVLLAHLGFALAGLAAWAAYLLTGRIALAWAALAALLPVAGLGLATLILSIPDPAPGPAPAPPPGRRPEPTRSDALAAAPAAAPTATRLAAGTGTRAARRPGRASPPVLLIAAHGALATITILLALLGAVAAVAAR